jgi:MoxR-like ATPase
MTQPFAALKTELNAQFPERRDVIEGALAAILAGEHVLMLGPPGTAKSALVRAIAAAFSGVYFERLMTRFSTPEELFGPVSLKALEQDRFARVTTGKLPEAEFAFVDEVFKSNSAILNSLLTAMNERLFHNDGAPTKMPLVSLFGASNEMPEGKELEALWDRFMVRFDVAYLSRTSNLRTMLLADEPTSTVRLTMGDLRASQAAAMAVKVTDAAVDALIEIREALAVEGIIISDRRVKKCLRLAKASAYLAGETEVTAEDMLCLVDALWREPKERTKVARVVGKVADPVSSQVSEVVDAARELTRKTEALKGGDRKAFVAAAASAMVELDRMRVSIEDLAQKAGKRTKAVALDGAKEISEVRAEFNRQVSAGMGLGARPLGR